MRTTEILRGLAPEHTGELVEAIDSVLDAAIQKLASISRHDGTTVMDAEHRSLRRGLAFLFGLRHRLSRPPAGSTPDA